MPFLMTLPSTGAEVPTPYATDLELACFPSVDDIVKVVKATIGK